MKNKFYLKEFQYFDGESFVTFNIYDLNESKKTITVAITNQGRISLLEYDLLQDEEGLYFEYGVNYTRINVDDFEEVND